MSSLLRNLPVIALTVAVAVSLYFLYAHIASINDRVDRLSQEVLFAVDGIHDLTARLDMLAGMEDDRHREDQEDQEDREDQELVEVGEDEYAEDDAESVEDVDVQDVSAPYAFVSQPQPVEEGEPEAVAEAEAEPEAVQSYIGNLERFLRSSTPDDAASEASEMSSVTALTGKRKSPPYSARTFELGHEEEWNGKIYTVMQAKNGTIRWSGAKPLPAPQEGQLEV